MEFMVSIQFNAQDRAQITALIPQEQAHLQALREQGISEAIYISADLAHVWLIMRSESQDHLQKTLEAFPLYPYMHLEIFPLSGTRAKAV